MEPIVGIEQGKLIGTEEDDVLVFRGIPYAAPPTGDLRFRPPRPPASWDGTRDATSFGAICPQNAGIIEQMFGAREPLPQDEGCLTLNVWTPTTDGELPVMVWIHGGAFAMGSGASPWYDGRSFARNGVVLVTINYRLGPLGFLNTGETTNLGIRDQIAALRWVQDNIEAFGGDPGNVTIFGESAGGMSCGTLLASPKARGLFHKAIPQSGAAHTVIPAEAARRVADRIFTEAGVEAGDLDALRGVEVTDLVEIAGRLGLLAGSDPKDLFGEEFAGIGLPFQPVVDGDVLEAKPIDAIRDGAATGVDVLVGTTRDEWNLFTAMVPEDQGPGSRIPLPLRNSCEAAGRDADEIVSAYETDGRSEVDVRNALETDRIFRIPAVRLAEAQQANGAASWMYRFDWPTKVFGGRLGACHALEIPFAFDNLDAPGIEVFPGADAPQEVADAMHAAWVSFATTGDPGWPAYTATERTTMLFDVPPRTVTDPDAETRELWDGIL